MATAVKNANLSDNVIDLKGNAPTLENFNSAVNVIENISGYAANLRLYISPNARNFYKAQLLKDKRYLVGGDHSAEVEGIKANKVVYDGGEFPMRKDMFLNPVKCPRRDRANNAFIATGSTPPAVPTITAGAGEPRKLSLTRPPRFPPRPTTTRLSRSISSARSPRPPRPTRSVHGCRGRLTPSTSRSRTAVRFPDRKPRATSFTAGLTAEPTRISATWRRSRPAQASRTRDNGSDIPDTSDMFLVEWDHGAGVGVPSASRHGALSARQRR